MRFIRKGGRVIPISDKKQSKKPKMVPAHLEIKPRITNTTAAQRFKTGSGVGAFFGLIPAPGIIDAAHGGGHGGKAQAAFAIGSIAAGAIIGGAISAAFGARKRTTWNVSVVKDRKRR